VVGLTAGQIAKAFLEDQDHSRWDGAQITEAMRLLDLALRHGRPDPYQLQAAIAAIHAHAPSVAQTDWSRIAALYTELLDRYQQDQPSRLSPFTNRHLPLQLPVMWTSHNVPYVSRDARVASVQIRAADYSRRSWVALGWRRGTASPTCSHRTGSRLSRNGDRLVVRRPPCRTRSAA